MTSPRILLVEDNPLNRRLVETLLVGKGFHLEMAENAEQAMDRIRKSPPDLILMDIQLPGMNGLVCTKILKSDPVTRRIPVLALTALAMKGDEERVMDAGCDGYVSKPIRYQEFLEKLNHHLHRQERPE